MEVQFLPCGTYSIERNEVTMKKIIILLFAVQLIVMSLYGLVAFRGHTLHSLLSVNTSTLFLSFETIEEYEFFLYYAEKNNHTFFRVVYINDEDLVIYTNDLTFDRRIEIVYGRWPYDQTGEFVSNIDTLEKNQVGVINNITPGFNISVAHLSDTRNFGISGTYHVNTMDISVLETLLNDLSSKLYSVKLVSINDSDIFIFGNMPLKQIAELMVVTFLISLCVISSLMQYSIINLKSSFILRLHGYSKIRLIGLVTVNLSKLLGFSVLISLTIMFFSAMLMGYSTFIILLFQKFLILCVFLTLLYLVLVNSFVLIYFRITKSTTVIKGEKPYFFIQAYNHMVKIAFTVCLFVIINTSLNSFNSLRLSLDALSEWHVAQNLYTAPIFYVGQSDLAVDLDVSTRLIYFYKIMSAQHSAFIMNFRNYYFIDMGLLPFIDESIHEHLGLALSPYGYRIDISLNFLDINPIRTVSSTSVYEQIIHDERVLNILVPETLKFYENKIRIAYLEHFYFNRVTVDNIYNYELGKELNNESINDLFVNLIFVESGQYYFTFDPYFRLDGRNRIRDPIAVIFMPGNIHPNFLHSHISQGGFFFYMDAIDAYSQILPLLLRYGLESVIPLVRPVFDRNARAIVELQEQYIRMLSLAFVLFLSSVAVTYTLLSNYFEKNKQKIFIKSLMGYTAIRRNSTFLASILSYGVLIVMLSLALYGMRVFLIGLTFLIFDMLITILMDRILTSKSFGEIIRGGGN